MDFYQYDLVETCSRPMCLIKQNARLGEEIYTRYKYYLDSSYSVFDSSTMETMLCISSLGSSVSETNQTGGKNTEAC